MDGHAEEIQQGGGGQGGSRRPFGAHGFVQTDHVRGVVRRQRQIVADHELGKAVFAPGRVQHFPEQAFALKVHARFRLVQHQQFRFMSQRRSQQHPPQLAAGKIAHAAVFQVPGPHQIQQSARPGARPGFQAHPERTALAFQRQKFADQQRQAAVHLQLLGYIAQARPGRAVAAFGQNAPGIRDFADETEQQGGFARAVGPHQHSAAAARHRGADILKDFIAAPAHAQALEDNGRGGVFSAGQNNAQGFGSWRP